MMNDFSPKILPEEIAPPYAMDCQMCELSKQRKRVIWGEGNPNARIFMLMDNPGAREDKDDRPFVCGTRETLQKGAYEVGLNMNDVYITYLLKCRPIRKYDKEMARNRCGAHLRQQLLEKKPELLLCFGNVAVQQFFQDPEASVKELRGQWYQIQGVSTTVTYHPLAVRRRPTLMRFFVEDLQRLVTRWNTIRYNFL